MKKIAHKFNELGEWVPSKDIEVFPDENGKYVLLDGFTFSEIPQPNWRPVFNGSEWVETITQEEILRPAKDAKMAELEALCDASIIAGFDYEINGISYHFSSSLAAQANFQGTDTLFKDGLITQAEWTVTNNTTGVVERIKFDQTVFNQLKLQLFQHINSNISKLRNELQPLVIAAQDQPELDKITW